MARSKEFEESVVLDKAMRLFWEQGYEKTSMTDLVEHMGIHRRSLYDTFGDKHTLFLKAVELYDNKISTALAAGVKSSKTATEALQFIVGFLICGEENPAFGCLMVNSTVELAARDADINNKSIEVFSTAEQLFKDIILWGQQDGEFTSEYDARELAEYLHNVGVGLRVISKTSITKEKLRRIANLSMQLIVK
ncbi:TetR/AcrR family transcriptional regulator [Paenibacillus sp. 28ISP30-2]|uniref:TetR/AcrR family transcriptional regulator n=1 Tax=Paenibacillus TaxID=44249 RepID=UPI000720C91A|nr:MULTISPECIES: TetR/AcrR family transcriptional regulator [Paenibacillus]ALP36260.1 TetR family transcriptional regulator [Paenibacillus sp. IHB B 3084]MBE0338149.1 TetR/AcrR family transcriptional regulator [Paenibacillus sp. 23TSA30-6]MBE0340682.1 TetR/AcrR family transcriptional regulator [Paenibacillus sp. 28ISP30-2]